MNINTLSNMASHSLASRLTKAGLTATAMLALCVSQNAMAAGTLAGTDIENTASATYEAPDGSTVSIDSNTVVIKVDELLDVVVDNTDPGDVATQPSDTGEVITFQVTNSGNGNETFTLTADVAPTGDDFDPILDQIILDTNNNGVYDPGTDTIYVAGSNDPTLAPDESINVFVIVDTPASVVDGDRAEVNLSAVSNTGSGTPGTSFTGQGDGGGDAVVGTTGADADDSGFLEVQAAILALVKSATVLDPFGGTTAVPGSVITYQIVATVSGTGSITNLVISDPIPANTAYNAGTIIYQAVGQSDGVDTDEGSFDGTNIAVDVGTLPSGENRTITFEVTIQ